MTVGHARPSPRAVCLLVGLLLCLAEGCDRRPMPSRDAGDAGTSADGCASYVARRLQPGFDSLSARDRCRLASRAYAQVVGRAQPEVAADGDARRITRIEVVPANRLDPATDTVLAVHWIVHFSLSQRPYDIEGVADGTRSGIVLRRTEKM